MKLSKITEDIAEIAKEAGTFIKHEGSSFDKSKVELKGKSDLVSYVDKNAEKILVKGLRDILPEASFITEEKTVEQEESEYTWIIDPLDGTTNFVHGMPCYAVSVGLAKQKEVIAGVVYEINRHEVFSAWKAGGAYLNGKPINVSDAESIDDSLFSTGFPSHNFEKLDPYLAILNELMKNSHGLRRVGSAATDLAYVACGRYEGFFEYNLKAWDIAAGIILVQEAGGKVTDFKGGRDYLFGREIVAGGKVQPELLRVIQQHW
ncbi:MAG: inositol monophosphatase [Cyclobacteriaceae bacterium]|nr:inositol monophosphatase [Cyclobacteriaceae bacterium HetDA_MAG_MS6]